MNLRLIGSPLEIPKYVNLAIKFLTKFKYIYIYILRNGLESSTFMCVYIKELKMFISTKLKSLLNYELIGQL